MISSNYVGKNQLKHYRKNKVQNTKPIDEYSSLNLKYSLFEIQLIFETETSNNRFTIWLIV